MRGIKHILTIMLLGFLLFDSFDLCLINFQSEKAQPVTASNVTQHHHHHEEMATTTHEEPSILQLPYYTIIAEVQSILTDSYSSTIWQPPKRLLS